MEKAVDFYRAALSQSKSRDSKENYAQVLAQMASFVQVPPLSLL